MPFGGDHQRGALLFPDGLDQVLMEGAQKPRRHAFAEALTLRVASEENDRSAVHGLLITTPQRWYRISSPPRGIGAGRGGRIVPTIRRNTEV